MKNLYRIILALGVVIANSCTKESGLRKKIGGIYEITEYNRQILDLNGTVLKDTSAQNIGTVNFIDQDKSLYTSNDGLYDLTIFTYAFDALNSFSNTSKEGDFEWGNSESDKKVLLQTYDAASGDYFTLPFTIKKIKRKRMTLVFAHYITSQNNEQQYVTEEFEMDQIGN